MALHEIASSRDPGGELDYVEITSNVACTATTEGTANTVVTSNAVTCNGSEIVLVEFFTFLVTGPNAIDCFLWLYDNGASIGRIFQVLLGASNSGTSGVFCARRLTPSAGVHTYSIRGSLASAGTFTVLAGTGGLTGLMPAYIRVIRA